MKRALSVVTAVAGLVALSIIFIQRQDTFRNSPTKKSTVIAVQSLQLVNRDLSIGKPNNLYQEEEELYHLSERE
jgi:hydrogenase-4 membrane subunit HyfE